MLDRLISGAGAVTHLADRVVRAFLRGGSLAHQPAGLLLAGLLGVGALVLVVFALDNAGDPTPRTLSAAEIATGDHGDRAFATVTGGLAAGYVETYVDDNRDGIQQPEESGQAWNYFLVDPTSGAGVTVTSRRPPSAVYTYAASGVVVDDATYVGQDVGFFRNELTEFGVTLDPTRYIDTRDGAPGVPHPLAVDLPSAGTVISISGSRGIDYLTVCSVDTDNDGICSDDEVDLYDLYVYDPVSKRAVTVLTDESPEFAPASFTGVMRRSPAAVQEATEVEGGSITDMGISVSPTYLLTDGDAPSDPLPMVVVAGLALALAAIIAVGALGGYLRFQPGGPTPSGSATLAPGEGIPVRVTGHLRGPAGLVHVRETAADLKRFVLAPSEDVDPTPPSVSDSTLILERRGQSEGVAVGRDELTDIRVGTVTPLRGNRPALRLTAGTGPLLVSFATSEARDRAAAELAAEAGLRGPRGD
ncbi:MAG: hypothetical protein ACRDIL_22470 [Candidatus Limnocylindrales bacterium]